MRLDVAALTFAILFLVFIAYEIAGGSEHFPDLHTLSYYAQHHALLRFAILVLPPAIFQLWWLWHMAHVIPK